MPPPKDDDRPRLKKWATKVRTGCLTCRSRRIKCDEGKPECRKCVSTGRKCGGYSPSKSAGEAASPKNLAALVPRSRESSQGSPSDVRDLGYNPVPPGVSTTPEGNFIMHFFRSEACRNIGGAIDKKFWSIDLLQATMSYPIIWHSCSAFAALYLRRNESRYSSYRIATNEVLETFALSQYNHAIRCAIELASNSEQLTADQKHAILMSSIIFTGVGYLRGNTTEALLHLRNGVNLFNSWKVRERLLDTKMPETLLSARSLTMLFRRFTTQSRHLRDESWPETKWTEESEDHSESPFASPTEAYFSIEPIYSHLVTVFEKDKERLSSQGLQPPPDESYDIRRHFDSWKSRFLPLDQSQSLSMMDKEGLLILRVRREVIESGLVVMLAEQNIALDTIEDHFRTMLGHAEELLELQLSSWRTGETFSFSASVCEALSFIATSCRNRFLKQRAMESLKKWPLMDGVYDAGLLGRISDAYNEAYRKQGRDDDSDSVPGSDSSASESGETLNAVVWIQPDFKDRQQRLYSQLPFREQDEPS